MYYGCKYETELCKNHRHCGQCPHDPLKDATATTIPETAPTSTKMLSGKALGIFHDINTPAFTDEEKQYAIYHVLSHLNPKAIKKDAYVEVTKYLFEKHTGIHLERNHETA